MRSVDRAEALVPCSHYREAGEPFRKTRGTHDPSHGKDLPPFARDESILKAPVLARRRDPREPLDKGVRVNERSLESPDRDAARIQNRGIRQHDVEGKDQGHVEEFGDGLPQPELAVEYVAPERQNGQEVERRADSLKERSTPLTGLQPGAYHCGAPPRTAGREFGPGPWLCARRASASDYIRPFQSARWSGASPRPGRPGPAGSSLSRRAR